MRIIQLACLLVFLSGCATQKLPPVDQVTRTFDAPFDKVWGSIVAETTASYPIQVIEKQSGILETQTVGMTNLRGLASPPSLFLPVWTSQTARFSIFVRSDSPTNTFVRVKGQFQGFESNVTHAWYTWSSAGVLENQLMDKVLADLH